MDGNIIDYTKAPQRKAFSYMGGKTLMSGFLSKYMPDNIKGCYIEPFLGGGGVLLNRKVSLMEEVNDSDNRVIALYRTLSGPNCKNLLRRLEMTPFHEETFATACKQTNDNNLSDEDSAYYLLCLMYQGFGCLIDSPSKGQWLKTLTSHPERGYGGMNFASKFSRLPYTLDKIIARIKNVRFHNCDYQKFLNRFPDESDKLIYADPPYFGNVSEYQNKFSTKEEHINMIEIFNSFSNISIAISGYKSDLYLDLLKDWDIKEFDSRKWAGQGGGRVGSGAVECLWRNKACVEMNDKEHKTEDLFFNQR